MSAQTSAVTVDRCPLCSSSASVVDSVPGPNLYSEKLASLLGQDEVRLLEEHANWRCTHCDLIFKPRWFPEQILHQLFTGSVGQHPKGWDAVLGRFSADGFRSSVQNWVQAVEGSSLPEIRRGQRELTSVIDSIAAPPFDVEALVTAIRGHDVRTVREAVDVVAAAIGDPLPFKRFSGFRSMALWDYLQDRTGGFDGYAEVGCPLWGLLPLAVESGCQATYLYRQETNYWGGGCINRGEHCAQRLLGDHRIRASAWYSSVRHPVIGVFQYLDHPVDPLTFLRELFDRSRSAAIILDAQDGPVAIQHATGWTEDSIRFAAGIFGKDVHSDFGDIRPSGNRLYVLTGSC